MSYVYNFKKTVNVAITPQDIYGTHETPKISGYKIVDFRPPKNNEMYIINNTEFKTKPAINWSTNFLVDAPRYIVEKTTTIPETLGHMVTVHGVYGGPVEIPDGYRFVDFRTVRQGDLYINPANVGVVTYNKISIVGCIRIIVEKI